MLNLDSNSSTSLMFLDDVLNLVIDLERRTATRRSVESKRGGDGGIHLSEGDNIFLLRLWIDSDDTERRSNSK